MSDNNLPVKLEVSAKANLEVKAEIPKEATGRLVEALTDIIRPWTEGRGLKADRIRLQREEVAVRIAELTAQKLAALNRPINPIPLKVAIPLLEKGSQESPEDNFMIECWATLLASSTKEGSVAPRFVSLLGDLTSGQAKELDRLYQAGGGKYAIDRIQNLHTFIEETITESAQQSSNFVDVVILARENPQTLDRLLRKGFQLCRMALHYGKAVPAYRDAPIASGAGVTPTDIELLQSLGLLRVIEMRYGTSGVSSEFSFYGLTALGIDLMRLCHPENAPGAN